MEQKIGKSASFFSKAALNRQYMVLRILMYHFVRVGEMTEWGESLNFQQLLDRSVALILEKDSQWLDETADAFREATEEILEWEQGPFFYELEREKGKERQAKTLGYIYNVVWMCRKRGYIIQRGLEQAASDRELWKMIENEKVSIACIRKHFDMIEERLQ